MSRGSVEGIKEVRLKTGWSNGNRTMAHDQKLLLGLATLRSGGPQLESQQYSSNVLKEEGSQAIDWGTFHPAKRDGWAQVSTSCRGN